MKKYVFCTGAILIMASLAIGQPTTFYWNPNTETDLAGYRIYCDAVVVDTGLPPITNGDVTYLISDVVNQDGTYTCYLTAYDTSANESGGTPTVNFTLDTTSPGVPGGWGVR